MLLNAVVARSLAVIQRGPFFVCSYLFGFFLDGIQPVHDQERDKWAMVPGVHRSTRADSKMVPVLAQEVHPAWSASTGWPFPCVLSHTTPTNRVFFSLQVEHLSTTAISVFEGQWSYGLVSAIRGRLGIMAR